MIPTTSVPKVSTDTSGPVTYSSTSTAGIVGWPRSSWRWATSPAVWMWTSAASQHSRTPRLPVPSAGLTTTGNPMPRGVHRFLRGAGGDEGGNGHPGALQGEALAALVPAALDGDGIGSREPEPGGRPGGDGHEVLGA